MSDTGLATTGYTFDAYDLFTDNHVKSHSYVHVLFLFLKMLIVSNLYMKMQLLHGVVVRSVMSSGWDLLILISHLQRPCTYIILQWNPSKTDTCGTKDFVLYRKVSLTQG